MLLFTVLSVVGFVYWVTMAVLLRRVMRAVPVVRELHGPPPTQWPRVSLIMPARNEERAIEAALRSKLRETYPELELILVNDRPLSSARVCGWARERAPPPAALRTNLLDNQTRLREERLEPDRAA
jgi:cellulose synthase/poly-beta-1,6-N-acetylglucosamine synthase-like glycosyltransferase